jgi:type I restriction enzyme S subunit
MNLVSLPPLIPKLRSMTQTQEHNVPTLRFPGFEGAWELVSLSQKVMSIKSGRTKHVEVGKHPVYGSTGLLGFTDQAEFEGQNLLVARVGANAGQLNRADGIYGVTDNTLVITPSDQINLGFLEASLRRFDLNRLVFGSGQPLITGTMLKRLKREFPTLPEQRKIADFLGAVDEKIAQLSRKKALLEDYKKGCMQRLFSQKVRFTDDAGNDFPCWEEKLLGDIATFSKGKGISKADIAEEGENSCIRYGELYTKYTEYITNAVSRTDTPLKGAALSKENDVLMPTSDVTPSGLATASALDIKNIILGGDILIIRCKELLNRFFAYFVAANKPKIMRLVTGVTVYHIYGKDLASLHLKIPHLAEQRKIADFLSAIDRKIDLVAQELAHARSFKAGLLQQMFV